LLDNFIKKKLITKDNKMIFKGYIKHNKNRKINREKLEKFLKVMENFEIRVMHNTLVKERYRKIYGKSWK
jgi:hypothetical protein